MRKNAKYPLNTDEYDSSINKKSMCMLLFAMLLLFTNCAF